MKKIILDLEPGRTVRLAPHRFRVPLSNLIVIESENGDRVDLHLTNDEVAKLLPALRRRVRKPDK